MARNRWYRWKYVWLTLIVTGGVSVFGAYRYLTVKADKPGYIFGTVDRGDVVLQVAATGTLQAVTTVQVGTQVSGTIAELYADFNSEVKKDQLLARLDPALFQAQVDQADANVRTAEAAVNDSTAAIGSAQANLQKGKVDVLDKQRKLKRQQEIFDAGLIPRDDLETAQAASEAAVATQKALEAELTSTIAKNKADQARLVQARAALETARVNLEHTVIRSPISGTIISRSVDRGQTVAASFSSPTLFTIAADLTKMQVNTNIDEADVGRIKTGMPATFSVDAYPGETFQGAISQVRLAATTVQNVVTYNAIIDVDNSQLKLKPGMTTNVKILIESADAVLKLPNGALRFRPTLSDAELEQAYKRAGEEKYYEFSKKMAERSSAPGAGGASGMANSVRGSGTTPRNTAGASARATRGRRVPVWVLGEDKLLRPVVVKLGLTDGINTEIVEGKLKQGDKLILSAEVDGKTTAPVSRPPGFGGMPGGGGFRR
jgi:HlyD family secretion protein